MASKKNPWLKKLARWIKSSLEKLAETPPGRTKRKLRRTSKPIKRKQTGLKLKPRKKAAVKQGARKKVSAKKVKSAAASPARKKNQEKPVRVLPKKAARVSAQTAPQASKAQKTPGALVGTISHYFDKAKACAFRVVGKELKQGDTILIQGATTKFKMKIKTIQINRIPVPSGRVGEDIGIGVTKPVEAGDSVYLIVKP